MKPTLITLIALLPLIIGISSSADPQVVLPTNNPVVTPPPCMPDTPPQIPIVPKAADKLVPGDACTVKGNIATPGAQESWKFYADAGDVVHLKMADASKNIEVPTLRVYSPTGKLLHEDTKQFAVEFDVTIPISGKYTVICSGKGTGTFAYGLSIAHMGSSITPVKLTR